MQPSGVDIIDDSSEYQEILSVREDNLLKPKPQTAFALDLTAQSSTNLCSSPVNTDAPQQNLGNGRDAAALSNHVTLVYDDDYVKPNACCLHVTHIAVAAAFFVVASAVLLLFGHFHGTRAPGITKLRRPALALLVFGFVIFCVAAPLALKLEWRNSRLTRTLFCRKRKQRTFTA